MGASRAIFIVAAVAVFGTISLPAYADPQPAGTTTGSTEASETAYAMHLIFGQEMKWPTGKPPAPPSKDDADATRHWSRVLSGVTYMDEYDLRDLDANSTDCLDDALYDLEDLHDDLLDAMDDARRDLAANPNDANAKARLDWLQNLFNHYGNVYNRVDDEFGHRVRSCGFGYVKIGGLFPMNSTVKLPDFSTDVTSGFKNGFDIGGGIGFTVRPGFELSLGYDYKGSLGIKDEFRIDYFGFPIETGITDNASSSALTLNGRIYPGRLWDGLRPWTICDDWDGPRTSLYFDGGAGVAWNRIDKSWVTFFGSPYGQVTSHSETSVTGSIGTGIHIDFQHMQSPLSVDLGYRYEWLGKFQSGNEIDVGGTMYPYEPWSTSPEANTVYAQLRIDF